MWSSFISILVHRFAHYLTIDRISSLKYHLCNIIYNYYDVIIKLLNAEQTSDPKSIDFVNGLKHAREHIASSTGRYPIAFEISCL